MLKINLDIWSSSIIFNRLVPSKIFPNESGQLSIASTSIRQFFYFFGVSCLNKVVSIYISLSIKELFFIFLEVYAIVGFPPLQLSLCSQYLSNS